MENIKNTRTEHDLLGTRELPADALYGIQTLRGIENFSISKFKLQDYPLFIHGLAYTKLAAAKANNALGLVSDEQLKSIEAACKDILDGKYHDQFQVDMIQGGAGTSTNMNANEVIANIALLHLGKKAGEYEFCSPHDTINRSQSTNDAYPTAIHMGLYASHLKFLPHLEALIEALQKKGDEFAHIIKMGRTQLEDAVPMTLGQTFYGFASILRNEIKHLNEAAADFLVVNMGSTAIGTGICSEPGYAEKTIEALKEITGWEVSLADDWVGATSDTSCMVGYMSALKRVAVKINKICNDLRLLASGPRCGFGEINLPARQPGSSIMPGKVNPVIPEVMSQIAFNNDLRLLASGPRCGFGEINLPARQPGSSIMPGKVNPVIPEVMSQIAFKVMGNELCVTLAGEASQMELNAMEPIMAQCCFESIDLLINGFDTLRTLCIDGITANEEACRNEVKRSIGVVTALNPYIGYDHSTYIAKKAMETALRIRRDKSSCTSAGFINHAGKSKSGNT